MHRPAPWRSGSWSWLLLAALLLVTTRARADDEPSHPTGPERAAPEVPLHEAASALRALLERAGVPAAVQGFTAALPRAKAARPRW